MPASSCPQTRTILVIWESSVSARTLAICHLLTKMTPKSLLQVDAFWKSLKEIATSGNMSLSDLLAAIDSGRHHGNLSSAIRLFVLNFYREQLLHRLDVRDKREAIQGLISGSARKSSKTPPSS